MKPPSICMIFQCATFRSGLENRTCPNLADPVANPINTGLPGHAVFSEKFQILESGRKWIENALPGLRIGQNESQDHDESNATPPDPKYRSRKFKIPLKSEISEIQKCPLNLATNRRFGIGPAWGRRLLGE